MKSCIRTRAGVKAISLLGSSVATQRATFSTSSAVTADPVLVAEQVLEQDLERVGQARDVVLRLEGVEPEDLVGAVAYLESRAGVERVRASPLNLPTRSTRAKHPALKSDLARADQ